MFRVFRLIRGILAQMGRGFETANNIGEWPKARTK